MNQPDRIHLRDFHCEAEIGAFAEERGHRQRLRMAITADLAVSVRDAGDDVDRILSYDVLVAAAEDALSARRYDLVETLAEEIAGRVLADPRAARVEVRVEKLDRGPFALGVTLVRDRGDSMPAPTAGPVAIAVEGTAGAEQAALLVPKSPGLPLPEGGDRLHMAWLALDQQALSTAARLGLPVVDSRTEMTAMIEAGRRAIWAPCRMARAAIGLDSAEPGQLAAWLRTTLAK